MMNKDINIKLLTQCQDHIPELASLWFEEIGKHWIPNASVALSMQDLAKHLNNDKMPMTFIALSEGKPIGMASLRENDGIQPEFTPWLGSLVVHPAYRKCKIGERLVETIKKQAETFGYEKIYLLAFDLTIPRWYEKLNWEKIGVMQFFNQPVTMMSIDL